MNSFSALQFLKNKNTVGEYMNERALKLLRFLKETSNENNESCWSLLALQDARLFGCKMSICKHIREFKRRGFIERRKQYCAPSVFVITQKGIDYLNALH